MYTQICQWKTSDMTQNRTNKMRHITMEMKQVYGHVSVHELIM